MGVNDGDSEHILDSDANPFDRLVLEGKVRCARCGTVITPLNAGRASCGMDENGEIEYVNAHCRDCTRIVTRRPES